MATVRQSGGDYGSLNAACAAAETTITIDQAWTVNDTTAVTISTTGTTITVSGAAKHPGYWNTAGNHYRLVSSSNCITLDGNYTATLDGIAVEQTGTGGNECFRCIPGTSNTVTIKNSILHCTNTGADRDCIYTGLNKALGPINLENSIFVGADRGGVSLQNCWSQSLHALTLNINSCVFFKNGLVGADSNGGRGGGIYFMRNSSTANQSNFTVNIHNTLFIQNTVNAFAKDINNDYSDIPTSNPSPNISYCVDSDGSIATYIGAGSNNLASRTQTDSDTPGAGNWVVFEDITSSPYDLRLKDNAENDAQDAHAVATVHGLTIPGTDIIGTVRPQNTNYDIGAFEIAAAGATTVTITTGIDALIQNTGIAQTFSIDSAIQDTFSESVNIGALLAAIQTGQVSADAVLQALKSQDVSIDSLISATKSGQISTDALLLASLQSTTGIDAILTSIFSTTTGVDALLQSLLTQTVSIDSLLQSGFLSTSDIDSLLQATKTETASLGALLQAGVSANVSLDAILSGASTASIQVDSLLQVMQSSSVSLDAVLVSQGVSTESVSIDALIQDGVTNTASLDALLQDVFLSTAVLDAILQATRTGNLSLDALLVAAGEVLAQTSLDSLIQALVENTVSIDSLLQSPQDASTNLDAVLFLLGNEQVSIDSLLQVSQVTNLSMDSLIQALQSESVSIGALVAAQMSAGTSIDAILGFMASVSVNFDSILKATITQGVSLNAILGQVADIIIHSGRVVKIAPQDRYITIN